ncbi:MAG TPA: hypothetical protein PLJ76_11015, partial [Treponemataceae bacterium]|nr:hypothetical protein [Treponemataceae bacterium]
HPAQKAASRGIPLAAALQFFSPDLRSIGMGIGIAIGIGVTFAFRNVYVYVNRFEVALQATEC